MKSPVRTSIDKELLEEAISLFDAPVVVLDAERRIIVFNVFAEKLTNSKSYDVEGQYLGEALQLDENTSLRICPKNPETELEVDGLWDEVAKDPIRIASQVVSVKRKALRLSDGSLAVVLLFERQVSWEQRYKDMLDASPVVFFEAREDGRVTYGADQLSQTLGYEESIMQERTFFSFVDERQRDTLRDIWQKVLAGNVVRGREFDLILERGQVLPLWISFFPVRDVECQTVGVRGVASSDAIQKSLAHALEAAEERFSVVFRESSDPILILSMKGGILSANPAFERIIDARSADFFSGQKDWKDFVHPDDLSDLRKSITKCAQDQVDENVEFRIQKGESEPKWQELSLSVLHDEDGHAKGIMALCRDIGRHKQRELRLRRKARTMERRSARAQFLISKLKEFFTRINTLPPDIEGYLKGVCDILFEVYRPFLVLIIVDGEEPRIYQAGSAMPEDLVDEAGAFQASYMCRKVMETGLPLYCHDLRETDPYADDPFVKSLSVDTYLGAPLRDSGDKIRGTLALLDRDSRTFDSLDVELITVASLHVASRLRAEQQEEAKRELEDHVRQSHKMEAVGTLAGGIAHDFNNILSGILGFSSYLLTKVEPGTDMYRNISLIEKSAVRASDLTRQLLAFARRKHFAKEAVEMNEVINDALDLLQHTLPKNIIIEPTLDPNLPNVLGDQGQLHQVLMNLCLNAAEAAVDDTGRIKIETAHRKLNARERQMIRDASTKEYVCITVADNGQGMDADVLDHIFDPFFTTKTKQGGTGLGLSIVYGIITNHGGDIVAESVEGEGTTFRVYLPSYHGEGKKSEEEDLGPLDGSETILVVDDESIVRQMVTEVLKGHGYKVLSAESGEAALELYDEVGKEIDIVLLDIIMPGMDGEATFDALKSRNPKIRVLLTSGYARGEQSLRLLKNGALGLVHKPYKSEVLLRSIRKAIAGKSIVS